MQPLKDVVPEFGHILCLFSNLNLANLLSKSLPVSSLLIKTRLSKCWVHYVFHSAGYNLSLTDL